MIAPLDAPDLVFIRGFCAHAISTKISYAHSYMSRDMRFPTMWYVRPAEAQTSLRIRAV